MNEGKPFSAALYDILSDCCALCTQTTMAWCMCNCSGLCLFCLFGAIIIFNHNSSEGVRIAHCMEHDKVPWQILICVL